MISERPLFCPLNDTHTGRSTILAFKRGEHFIAEQAVRTDENHVFNYASWVANRFLGFWADAASNILILTAALFTVLRREDDGSMAGNSGLTLSYVISVSPRLTSLTCR